MQRVRPVSDYINDLRRWTTEVLSKPSDQLRGMPPCPFAADAWDAGLVAVGICDSLDDVTDALDFYPASRRDVFICVLPDVEGLTSEELARYVEDKNKVWWQKICGLWRTIQMTIRTNTD